MSEWRAKALELFPDMRSEIQSAESVGGFWIELISRFEGRYSSATHDEPKERAALIRSTCLYAIWCDRSESLNTQEAARIEFYEYLPSFALGCTDVNYARLVRDLVVNMGIGEFGKMGASLKPVEREKFLADARGSDDERRRLSRKK